MLAGFLLTSSPLTSADVVVIVNKDSGVSSLSASDVKKLFLGKSRTLPGGASAKVVDQPEGAATREEFGSKVLKKSPSQLKAYWSKLIFSGKGAPPQTMDDDAAVKAFVADNANGIGYVDAAAVDDSVTVVLEVK